MKTAAISLALLILSINPMIEAKSSLSASARRPTTALLKIAMKLPVVLNGKPSGWVNVPAGAQVSILHVRKQKVMIGLAESQAWVDRSSTDFDQRLAAFKTTKQAAQVQIQQARTAQDATFQKQKAKDSADFQAQHAGYVNPLERGAYDQRRSVVDYYDWLGRRYHIGSYGQRIYQ